MVWTGQGTAATNGARGHLPDYVQPLGKLENNRVRPRAKAYSLSTQPWRYCLGSVIAQAANIYAVTRAMNDNSGNVAGGAGSSASIMCH